VVETALTQKTPVGGFTTTNPEVFYYYGDYIECCSDKICEESAYREIFKVLAYSRTTKRLRLRRQTPLRSIQRCYVYKTVFMENDNSTFSVTSLFGNSAEWITNASSTDPTLNLTIQTGQTLRGGKEYRFKFTVRNPVPVEPYVTADNKGVDKVMIRVDSRSTAKGGLVKQRLEYALGVRAKKEMVTSQSGVSKRTKTADGQSFDDVKLKRGIQSTDTFFEVVGTDIPRKLGPGLEIMIGDEVMTVIHAMHDKTVSTVTDYRNVLKVKRGQQNTAATMHESLATVYAFLPGFRAGDGVPFKVQQKSASITYMRQSTALPGAANRLVTSLAFNYPVNAMDMVSITGLKGYSLRSTKFADPCSTFSTIPVPPDFSSPFKEHCPTRVGLGTTGSSSICPAR